ncbi:MAG: transposase [Ignavibacteria bacterium]|nr:transposase [Ignavibacteria bacterium]
MKNRSYEIAPSYCPMGQAMSFIGERKRKTATGYLQLSRLYQAVNCQGCPLRGACHTGKSNRVIEVNGKLNRYRKQAEDLLTSEKGIAFRKRRCCEPEPVFGNMKQNKGFKRFSLKGRLKVAIETGLVFLAHNIKRAVVLGYRTPAFQVS